jgi:hypothetical protein
MVKLFLVGGFVEVEVAAEDLIGALSGQHHLHAQGLDLAGHEEHGRAGADGGHVVRLHMVDHLRQRVQSLLHCEVELVVPGADVVGHFPGRLQIRRTLHQTIARQFSNQFTDTEKKSKLGRLG